MPNVSKKNNVPEEKPVLLLAELFGELWAKTCSSGNEGVYKSASLQFLPSGSVLFLLSGDH